MTKDKKMKKCAQVGFRCTVGMYERLHLRAHLLRTSASALIESYIIAGLENPIDKKELIDELLKEAEELTREADDEN